MSADLRERVARAIAGAGGRLESEWSLWLEEADAVLSELKAELAPQAEPVWQYRMATHPRGWIDTSAEDAARWAKGGFEVRCLYALKEVAP